MARTGTGSGLPGAESSLLSCQPFPRASGESVARRLAKNLQEEASCQVLAALTCTGHKKGHPPGEPPSKWSPCSGQPRGPGVGFPSKTSWAGKLLGRALSGHLREVQVRRSFPHPINCSHQVPSPTVSNLYPESLTCHLLLDLRGG